MPKRYKGNYSKEKEIISAKSIFDLCEKLGEGVRDLIHIYDVTDLEDQIKSWRCDMGEFGGFTVSKYAGEEELDTVRKDWIWIVGEVYKYRSISSNYNGYPNTTIEDAYDMLLAHTTTPQA